MSTKFPLVLNRNLGTLEELAPGDSLDLEGSNIVDVVDVTVTGNIQANSATFLDVIATGTTHLGDINNVIMTGGEAGQVATTDGNGNLSWTTVAGFSGTNSITGANSSVTIADDGLVYVTINDVANTVVMDEFGVNVAGILSADTVVARSRAELGAVGNIVITGGNVGAVLTTDGNGVLSWSDMANDDANYANFAGEANISNVAYSVDAANVVGLDLVVGNAISALVDGAPDALNTLNELANALANDASYSTTIVNSLANKVEFTTFQDYTVITDATIANLATSANLQTLADTTANALANKVESTTYQTYVDDTANVIANLVTTDTLTAYQGDVSNTVANLATISYVDTSVSNAVANVLGGAPEVLDTLSELANALGNDASFITTITSGLANKVETTTYDLFVSDTGNTIANLVTTDTFTQYQGDVSNALANTASWQELEDGLANKVYSNVFNDTVANLVGTTTFNDTVANLATITYVDNSIANIPSVDLTPYATITYVDDSIANIPPTDLSAYSTTTEVNGLISTALSGHGNIVSVNLSGNTSQLLAGDGTWIDRITLGSANAVSISVSANGAGQSFQDNEFIHYTGNVKPMLFKNGVFVDLGEYSIASNSITFTNNLNVGDQIDVMPTQIAVVSGGNGSVDLSNYATHQDVADAINLIPSPNLDAYATNVSVDNKIANIAIPDITGLASETFVTNSIANIPQPNLSAYATNTSVDNKIANITFPTYGNVANLNLNGNASTYLAGNGTWQAVSGGGGSTPPAGANTQLQFNNNGAFGASANLVFTDNGIILGNPIPANKITLDKFGSIGARSVNARDGMTASHAEIGEITVNRLLAVLTDGAPVSSSDTGLKGEVRYDTQFMYLCVDDNVWARIALNTTW